MVKRWLVLLFLALPLSLAAQEVLLPLQRALMMPRMMPKDSPDAVSLPFFDDFANGASTLWQPVGGATVTWDVSPYAPTVGVMTLDALDADGKLYSQATTTIFPADTLTSVPIRLDSLTSSDMVLFSFYYLPGGGYGNMWERVGDTPDPQDSIFLDFYCARDSAWVTIWSRDGISVDTLMARTGTSWQYVEIQIADSVYFDSAFMFRFRNYASLESSPKVGRAGNCDYWHLDYVRLYRVSDGDTVTAGPMGPTTRDVAFAAPAPSMLDSYRAMPYRQYLPAAMANSLSMTITNRYSSTLATHYTYAVLDSSGDTLHHYDGGFENATPFQANGGTYQTAPMHATPTVSFAFPTMMAPTDYTVVHVVREGTGGDNYPLNDTVRYRQHFGDYYAYDDGTAENGYGLTSTASRLYLAYRFDLTGSDTLTAVDLFFNRTLDDGNATIPFYLTLWSIGDDGHPSEVLYRDEERRHAAFDGFKRYVLEAPTVVDGSVFVGFEQTGNDYINLGFDRSLNSADRIWYLTGTEWQQSILSGSLMLRPCFGVAATVGINDNEPMAGSVEWRLYPNPTADMLYIDGIPSGTLLQLYDVTGRKVLETNRTQLSTRSLPDGLYLLHTVTPDGITHTDRIIIKH